MSHHGHVFVVHGLIEQVVHDAAVIPVDDAFDFNCYWEPLVGEQPAKPPQWKERGWGRIVDAPDRVWALSIGNWRGDSYTEILCRLDEVLVRLDERRYARPRVRGKGSLPLIAVPVIGIGLGGHGRDRGTVLRLLLERLEAAATNLRMDIALVTPDPAVYAAAQYARKDVRSVLPEVLEAQAKELGVRARKGEIALLLGAGVSVPAGLVSWHQLIEVLAADAGMPSLKESEHLTATDQAELIERNYRDGFQQKVASVVAQAPRPSLLHALLAALDCREVVTTNYDTLYERAVEATGRDVRSVMPWASAHGAPRWILKLHGDHEHPDKIVLTRRHMVLYDAANKPSAALLQSLLLTKRLVIVGCSMTDDNVIRMLHEVSAYRTVHQDDKTGTFGTNLDIGGDDVRRQLWEDQLDWIRLDEEVSGQPGRRTIELFLDRVALHASRDSSWLLDERFEGLLGDPRDRELADGVRRLAALLPQREGTKWTRLVQCLKDLGYANNG